MSWKSTSFSEMGSGAPSQNIQPLGAKLPANILISPTYGWPMVSSSSFLVPRWENALEGDDEVEHQVGHHVVVRLRPADAGDCLRHRDQIPRRPVNAARSLRHDNGVVGRGGRRVVV